ncbi:DUF4188 domain-containing protein [Alkalihalobacillus oceani]|uniref:DUF4188 domain-containing protein n=1 Tax=Halalkalibacter oceani TaxID=1653776 RepID=UPI002040C4FB|nr:DUF4188 domain-containing protein [Halalkalibacter oceani]
MNKRYTAPNDRDIVLFIIGMRIQQWWNIKAWWPVFTAMPPMMKELYAEKDNGFLSHNAAWGGRTIVFTQYWEDIESLHAYAHGQTHLKAWTHFYQKAAKTKAVGVFHEICYQGGQL